MAPTGDLANGPEVTTPVNGILGFGYQGGAGVVGRGDAPDKWRDGVPGRGTGGPGVVGLGGSGDVETKAMEEYHSDRSGKFNPGAGVVGVGGYWIGPAFDGTGTRRRGDAGGPGVTGVAGDNIFPQLPPPLDDPRAFDVYAGVGVCGISYTNVGILAQGKFVGVKGKGFEGPGGYFESGPHEWIVPQLHLEPNQMVVPNVEDHQVAPTCLRPTLVKSLPKEGRAGDLLVTINPDITSKDGPPPAVLWFCTVGGGRDGKDGVAVWRQVLLGPPMERRSIFMRNICARSYMLKWRVAGSQGPLEPPPSLSAPTR